MLRKLAVMLITVLFFTACEENLLMTEPVMPESMAPEGAGNFSLAKSISASQSSEPVTWSAETSPINSGRYRPLALGDINNDGYLDIVVSPFKSYSASGIRVWFGDGAGEWTAGTGPTNFGHYHGIALGDVNNDGNLDIVAGMRGGRVDVWLGNGTGGWSANMRPAQQGYYYWWVALGDINNDGNLDIAAAQDYGGVDVWLGDGTGGWSPETGPTNVHPYHTVDLGDINNDGNLDLISVHVEKCGWACWIYKGISVWYGDGVGGWSADLGPTATGYYRHASLGDVNNDGNLDIIGPSGDGYGVEIWLGDGAGGWTSILGPVATGIYHIVSVADIDADGDLDIAAIRWSYLNNGISVWLNDGTGGWSADLGPTGVGNYYNPVLADINNDGFLDIAVGEYSKGTGGGIDVWFSIIPIPATVDINPDTLNLASRGKWITCYLELPEEYDVSDIEVGTILLNNEIPAEARPTKVGDHDADGISDLMVKFDRSAVQGVLEIGDEEITVTGELSNGRPFEGSDTITVIGGPA